MTRRFYPIYMMLAGAVVAAAADSTADPGGWTVAKWGMTLDQVRAVIPESVPFTGTGRDAARKLTIPHIEIGKATVTAYFAFTPEGKLTAVEFQAHDSSVSPAMFVDLDRLLSEKYARPFERSEDSNRTAEWSFPTTTITLRYTHLVPIKFESLWLSYTQPEKPRI